LHKLLSSKFHFRFAVIGLLMLSFSFPLFAHRIELFSKPNSGQYEFLKRMVEEIEEPYLILCDNESIALGLNVIFKQDAIWIRDQEVWSQERISQILHELISEGKEIYYVKTKSKSLETVFKGRTRAIMSTRSVATENNSLSVEVIKIQEWRL